MYLGMVMNTHRSLSPNRSMEPRMRSQTMMAHGGPSPQKTFHPVSPKACCESDRQVGASWGSRMCTGVVHPDKAVEPVRPDSTSLDSRIFVCLMLAEHIVIPRALHLNLRRFPDVWHVLKGGGGTGSGDGRHAVV